MHEKATSKYVPKPLPKLDRELPSKPESSTDPLNDDQLWALETLPVLRKAHKLRLPIRQLNWLLKNPHRVTKKQLGWIKWQIAR